jgi:peptidoglycan L-alanyl-D-glutamate endopeptidase CwlK
MYAPPEGKQGALTMSRKYSARSLKNLNGVHPDLRRVIDRALLDSPLDFVVIEGLRTKERQKELVASGASKTMNSRHLTGHAVDLVPIGPNGKAAFDWPLYDKLGPAVKAAAEKEGVALDWGGDWTSFKDGPHFELDRKVYPEGDWTSKVKPPAERTDPSQSTTVRASAVQIASGAGAGVAAVGALDGTAQVVALVFVGIVILAAAYIMRERIKKWAEGVR